METYKHYAERASDSTKDLSREKGFMFTSTRKRLLEQALLKDNIPNNPKSARQTSNTETFSSNFSKQINPISRSSHLKPPAKSSADQKTANKLPARAGRSKSPTCTKRNVSFDLSKNLNSSNHLNFSRGKSVGRIRPVLPQKPAKNFEKPTDKISEIANQFSVKKLNVSAIQELKYFSGQGDRDLCRALVALLSEVDYHIHESQHFPIEIFLDYAASPGIVVQTIKKISSYLLSDKIPDSNFYLESLRESFEIYSSVENASNSPGFLLLASLLSSIFEYKDLHCTEIKLQANCPGHNKSQSTEKLNSNFKEIEAKKKSPQKSHVKAESLSITPTMSVSKELFLSDLAFDNSESTATKYEIFENDPTREQQGFRDSKRFLLDRFFNKMNYPEIIEENKEERSPLKSILNKSIEICKPKEESKNIIRLKQLSRPSSTTPRINSSDKVESEGKVSKDFRLSTNNNKVQELKRKSIIVGSRFYKKLNEKFIEIFLEKISKEPKELKNLKITNFEEYSKQKNEFVKQNKDSWVKETVKWLENFDFSMHDENNAVMETKKEALAEFLTQEKNIIPLVSRAEQLEILQRRVY